MDDNSCSHPWIRQSEKIKKGFHPFGSFLIKGIQSSSINQTGNDQGGESMNGKCADFLPWSLPKVGEKSKEAVNQKDEAYEVFQKTP